MCEFTQREFSCGHFRWLASKHCVEYKTSQSRSACLPDITAFEERAIICGECRLKEAPPRSMFAFGKQTLAASRR